MPSSTKDSTPALSTAARTFRRSFENAEGESRFVIATIADIRGFSEFSTSHESPEVAVFIRHVYEKLITDFFPSADYYKATGDGLLIVTEFSQRSVDDLRSKLNAIVVAALSCEKEFPTICSDNPLVNFETPPRIGFGITRGPACRLRAGRRTFDYSGATLNLAARLMDKARPGGIVIDSAVGIDLIEKKVRNKFDQHDIFLRSIAEDNPRSVYVETESVIIRDEDKSPMNIEIWNDLDVGKHVPSTIAAWKREKAGGITIEVPDGIRNGRINIDMAYQSPNELAGIILRTQLTEGVHYTCETVAGKESVRLIVSTVQELLARRATEGHLTGSTNLITSGRYVPR